MESEKNFLRICSEDQLLKIKGGYKVKDQGVSASNLAVCVFSFFTKCS